MRPAPMGSGSSVSRGRCCAVAERATADTSKTAQTDRSLTMILSSVWSEQFSAVDQDRDGAVVDEGHAHHCLKLARRHFEAGVLELAHDVFVDRPGDLRR